MYKSEPDNFLRQFYSLMGSKVKRIIEINSKKSSSMELREMYETRDRLIEALDYMCRLNMNDPEMQKFFNTLAYLISSSENKDLNVVLDYCNKVK